MSETFRPRRLRLVQPDFAHYTGPIGGIEFIDGVSEHLVVWHEALRIGSSIHCEDADVPGFQINPSSELARTRDRDASDPIVDAVSRGEHVNPEGSPLVDRYTREELEEIADKKGLTGVREIARLWSRTGRSIQECITAVLEAQEVA